MVIRDNTDFRARKNFRDEEEHYKMIKEFIFQQDTMIKGLIFQ
jgi:hypothetical protein